MRARYSSFVECEIDFLQKSHHPAQRDEVNAEELEVWAKESKWLGLTIKECQNGKETDDEGTVEFVAQYEFDKKLQTHHELATFKKEDGVWYFVNGEILNSTLRRVAPKVGRNDPCPCNSGKKYKKCCLI
jgi:SEC-C motif-containing protein